MSKLKEVVLPGEGFEAKDKQYDGSPGFAKV